MDTLQLDSCFKPAGDQPGATRQAVEGLEAGLSHQTLLGVTGSGKTFSIASVIAQMQHPILVLAPNKTLAAQLYGESKTLSPHSSVEYFVFYYDYYQPEVYVSSSDTYVGEDSSINDHIEQVRLSATKALFGHPDAAIVATMSSTYGLGDSTSCLRMVLHLNRDDHIDQRELLRRLTSLQYTHNDTGFARVAFRVRGDVTDIFPAESDLEAIRAEPFGDEVESLSVLDPLTGEIIRKLPHFALYPKSYYVTPRETLLGAVDQIEAELKERLGYLRSSNEPAEAQRLEQRTHFDLEVTLESGCCNGIENHSCYLSGRTPGEPPSTLYDYLPADSLLVVDESHISVPQVGAMLKDNRPRKGTLVGYGSCLLSALDNRPLCFEEWETMSPQTISVSATLGPYEAGHVRRIIEQVVRPTGLVDPEIEVRPTMTQVDGLPSQTRQRVAKNEWMLVTTLTKCMAEDLIDYLGDHDARMRYLHSNIDTVERVEITRDLRAGAFDVLVGINLLHEDLNMPEVSLMAVLNAGKEGFLHPGRSLIQTIGRVAHNLHGKAILYADDVTDSTQRTVDETEWRRAEQVAFNQTRDIVLKGVREDTKDILEGVVAPDVRGKRKGVAKVTKESGRYENELRLPSEVSKHIHQLKEKVYQLVRDLESEVATQLRDETQTLRERLVNV